MALGWEERWHGKGIEPRVLCSQEAWIQVPARHSHLESSTLPHPCGSCPDGVGRRGCVLLLPEGKTPDRHPGLTPQHGRRVLRWPGWKESLGQRQQTLVS